jgi:branched-chain amino acid aminotransferase
MPVFSIDGTLCSEHDASISVMDHGLLYGDGIFEGLRFYNRRIFKLEAHLERLFDSARALLLVIPMQLEDLVSALNEAMLKSSQQNGYIRLVITRGEGALGIDPSTCVKPRVIIIVDELKMVDSVVLEKGASLIISSIRRLQSDQIDPRIKSLNYLNQTLARLEANSAGADEAIMLNNQGRIAEGTVDNIFIMKGGSLYTPPLFEGSLGGITRETVISIAHTLGIDMVESPLTPFDLYTADECFLTGTGAELIPVKEVSGRQISVVRGTIFSRIEEEFLRLTQNYHTEEQLAVC